jgi:hypothetical protein
MDMKRSILQCLEIIAVSTDVAKKPPPEPKSHDLGLLQEKCCQYVPSVAKAEHLVMHGELNNGGLHRSAGKRLEM